MGVLYEPWDDLRQLLVPFARAHGTRLPDEEIHRAYQRAMLGDISTSQLWNALGVIGDGPQLDTMYVSGYRLYPGILEMLDELVDRGIELGCISNDVAEWSLARRTADGLRERIRRWTISSEVRARKPDSEIYRAYLATTAFRPEEVVFVDDRAVNVEGAVALGLRGILVDFAHRSDHVGVPRSVEDLRRLLSSLSHDS